MIHLARFLTHVMPSMPTAHLWLVAINAVISTQKQVTLIFTNLGLIGAHSPSPVEGSPCPKNKRQSRPLGASASRALSQPYGPEVGQERPAPILSSIHRCSRARTACSTS